MNRFLVAILIIVFPVLGLAAGGHGVRLDKANNDLTDQASLQRGARLFVNYCLSCHSAHFVRYNRMAKDLGLSEEEVQENLMFASEKIGEVMKIAMHPEDETAWFGTSAPDLSVVARSRGTDWLYTYLRAFYLDDSRPFGVNNLVFKDVAMPHVLWELQGLQRAVFHQETDEHGTTHETFESFEPVGAEQMSEDERKMAVTEYDRQVRDLVNFLEYMGEPDKLERQRLGIKVLLFLAVFFVVAYLLKKEYWKDVH
jgi:ubiquinol-cytochrome c reductase cytochrome c1 subunit